MPRENLERQALERFEKIARNYKHSIFSGQGKDNRIPVSGNTYFQFGDLRVITKTHHIVIEVESAGGITNLVKYWYCLESQSRFVDKPIILLHVFRQSSEADYGSHLALWDFMWQKMESALGDARIKATRYTYRDITELEPIVSEFEKHLKSNPVSISG
jgi:hypothetical protein